jgi:hypothetical protein
VDVSERAPSDERRDRNYAGQECDLPIVLSRSRDRPYGSLSTLHFAILRDRSSD